MKFTCQKENLSKSLGVVVKAVPIKHSFPILTNVLLQTQEGRVTLSGTDFETSIITNMGAAIDEEGSITVPARELLEFLSHLSGDAIDVTMANDTLHIVSGKTKSKFNGITAQDYPTLPDLNDELEYIEINPKEFARGVSSVAFSISTDDSRPVFSGILLRLFEGNFYFVASDGYRLTESKFPLAVKGDAENIPDDFSVIIKAKTLVEVARIFSSMEENIKIYLNPAKNLCMFQCEDTVVSTGIIEGTYPDYKRIIPNETKVEAIFDADALAEAVKLTNVFTKNSSNSLKIKVDSEENMIHVYSSAEEMGQNTTDIPAEVNGDDLEIMFNSRYLLDFLSHNKSDKLVFKANNGTSPCIIMPYLDEVAEENNEDSTLPSFIHVMAPMNTN